LPVALDLHRLCDHAIPAARRGATAEEGGYIVRSEVSTLGFTLTDHRVVVADLGYGIDGLLGINFLRQFNVEIRFAGVESSSTQSRPERVARFRHGAADPRGPVRTCPDDETR